MRFGTYPAAAAAGLMLAVSAAADVTLPAQFSDHMVLQRNMALPVWGWAAPGERITVTLAGQKKMTVADDSGKWMVKLDAMGAGGPYTMTVEGDNTITINDVLIGEVWLCSGQSNMAMTVSRARDFEQERAASDYPKIRMFSAEREASTAPQEQLQGAWAVCGPDTVGEFSATAYFFGRRLHQELDVPIGLLNSSWGGTAIEAWTSWDAQKDRAELEPIFEPWRKSVSEYDEQKAKQEYQQALAKWQENAAKAKQAGRKAPRRPAAPADPRTDRNHPANLFNGMINPLIPYAICGTIWYQGERNSRTSTNAYLYRKQLPLLISDWRSRWDQSSILRPQTEGGDFPFLWVQLPNYKQPHDGPVQASDWALLRESMFLSLRTPKTGMAVTIDVGEAGDVHPKDKQTVGHRLAQWALAKTYGQDIAPSGPLFSFYTIRGRRLVINFRHTDGGLVAKGGELKGFAVAGEDGVWHPAKAEIDGLTVEVSSKKVREPVAVRYGWADNPDCNLVNGAGLPASPFRTDTWPGGSDGKY